MIETVFVLLVTSPEIQGQWPLAVYQTKERAIKNRDAHLRVYPDDKVVIDEVIVGADL